jgi:hypothetical protein
MLAVATVGVVRALEVSVAKLTPVTINAGTTAKASSK